MSLVQCSITDLNGVTGNDQIKHELREWGPLMMIIWNIMLKWKSSATNTTKMRWKRYLSL